LRPEIEATAEEGQQTRRVPQRIIDALLDAGLYRLTVPRCYGGEQVSSETLFHVVAEIAGADGSTAFTYGNGLSWQAIVPFLPEPGAREVLADPRVVIAGSLTPGGRATPVRGGYELSGRWPFNSGCVHAQWWLGSALIPDGEAVSMRPDGMPEMLVLFLPASDCQIMDTWDGPGLRATASHHITVEDVFVPESRAFPFIDGHPQCPGYPDHATVFDVWLATIWGATHAWGSGIARTAIDSFVALAAGKTPVMGQTLLRDKATVQELVAKAEALLRSARAFALETVREVETAWTSEGRLTDEHRALSWLTGVHTTSACAEAVDLVYLAAGASAVHAKSRLGRCWRDIHTLTQHGGVSHMNYEGIGKYFLGLPFVPMAR